MNIEHDHSNTRLSLDELCALTGLSRRTIRYYIQMELLDRPLGARKTAYYSRDHLRTLLDIQKWKQAGLSLERIRELVHGDLSTPAPPPPQEPGQVRVWSHIHIHPGVELHIDPRSAGLDPDQLREFTTDVLNAFRQRCHKEESE